VRRLGFVMLALVTPLLVAAARDPRGDVTACEGQASVPDPVADLVGVDAYADELGTAAVWRLRFAEPLPVPDRDAPPLRIDILVRDPRLPAESRGDERGMNRIVRWVDTSADESIDVIWLAEQAHTPFNPPVVDSGTLEIRVPGRILLGEAPNGSESVARVRWSVVVRDGSACDRLGDEPMMRLRRSSRIEPAPSPVPTVGGTADDQPGRNYAAIGLFVAVLVLVPAVVIAAILRRTSR
jgi:hypothetical protein